MAVAFHASTTTVGGEILAPAGTVAGDLLLLLVNATQYFDTITTPSGWTQLAQFDGYPDSNGRFAAYWKIAGASESGFYLSTASSDPERSTVLRISGHDATTPIGTIGTGVGDGTAITFPACGAGDFVVRVHGSAADQTLPLAPAGWTELTQATGAPAATVYESGADATEQTESTAISGDWGAISIPIQAASGGGGEGAMSATVAGTSAASASLTGVGSVSGSAGAESTAAALLIGLAPISGSAAGASTASAAVSGPLSLSGSAGAESTAAASVVGAGAISAAVGGVSTASVVVAGASSLSATVSGAATASAYLIDFGQLSGSAAGSSSASAAISGVGSVSASAAGAATASAVVVAADLPDDLAGGTLLRLTTEALLRITL